jgi:hypothetical protein
MILHRVRRFKDRHSTKKRGSDIKEVIFRDLVDRTGRSKASYNKIRFCGEQARRDSI